MYVGLQYRNIYLTPKILKNAGPLCTANERRIDKTTTTATANLKYYLDTNVSMQIPSTKKIIKNNKKIRRLTNTGYLQTKLVHMRNKMGDPRLIYSCGGHFD